MALYHEITGGSALVQKVLRSGSETTETVTGTGSISLPDAKANSLSAVTLTGDTVQRNLPEEYTEVEYLESSGTQYIKTNLVLNSVATVEMVAKLNTTVSTSPCALWGFMGNMGSGQTFPRWQCSVYNYRWLMDLNATTAGYPLADTDIHTLKNECFYNSNNALAYQSVIDGVEQFAAAQVIDNVEYYTENTLKVYLFARNNSGGVGNFVEGRIYQFKAIQDGALVCKLIPCKRNSDNVLGMYDTVSQTFLTNAGTGTFTAGSDAVPTPDRPIDIVCNNGVLKLSPNLFNKNDSDVGNGYISASAGTVLGTSRAHTGYFIVEPNTTYYVTLPTYQSGSTNGVAFYDSTRTYVSGISSGSSYGTSAHTFTVPNNNSIVYARLTLTENIADTNLNEIQIEKGSTGTPIIPYGTIYTDGTVEQVTDSLGNTASAEMLLSVGDYKDTQEVLNGNVTRNLKVLVLDGVTTGRKISEVWNSTYKRGNIAVPDFGGGDVAIADSLCSHFKYNQNVNGSPTEAGFCTRGADKLILFSFLGMSNVTSYQTANAWLAERYNAGTPVIVVYPLATATTESVTAQTLTTQQGSNTLSISQASISNLPISATYTKGVTVEADYVIREDMTTHAQKLVYANPRMYLSGPVNYTKVGSPTIVDNVASGLVSGVSYLVANEEIPSWNSDLEMQIEFTTPEQFSGVRQILFSGPPNQQGFVFGQDNKLSALFYSVDGNYKWATCPTALSTSTTYTAKITYDKTTKVVTLHTVGGNIDNTATATLTDVPRDNAITDYNKVFIGAGRTTSVDGFTGSINLNNTYIKVNGSLWFYGKNYASANIAPVPSGYTYGTTTTSAIGWVDMRTQTFTAAPTGATLGKDE